MMQRENLVIVLNFLIRFKTRVDNISTKVRRIKNKVFMNTVPYIRH